MNDDLKAPKQINSYSDGSLKNPTGNHWAIGGVGLWWPERKEDKEPLNKEESKYLEHTNGRRRDACSGLLTTN